MGEIAGIATLDRLLSEHAAALGGDFEAYRNHACRVASLCAALSPVSVDRSERIAIAAACHDIGIWTDRTFDYLQPSISVARDYLARIDRTAWTTEVDAMILHHHKLLPYRGSGGALVEAFRRADWIDVSRGSLRFGVPRAEIATLFARWPSHGFHRRLVELSGRRLRTHPWSPLPMVRL